MPEGGFNPLVGWNSVFNMEWRKFLDGNFRRADTCADNPSRNVASAVWHGL